MADDALSQSQVLKRKRIYEAWSWLRGNILPAAVIAVASALAGHFEAYIGFGYRLSALEQGQTAAEKKLDDTLGAGSQMQKDIAGLQEDVKLLMKDMDRVKSNLDLDYNEKIKAEREAARAARSKKP